MSQPYVLREDLADLIFRGDGTVSVIDVRANSTTPFAVSDDQEDELLSIVSIKGYVPPSLLMGRY
jgi:hypothetical protein